MRRRDNNGGGGRGGRTGRRRGGRGLNCGRGDQGSREGGYVARVSGVEPRTCYGCGEVRHIRRNCPNQSGDGGAAASTRVALAVGTGTNADSGSWIFDSGSSVHLVRDAKMLKSAMDCDQMCVTSIKCHFGEVFKRGERKPTSSS
ncbi:hypothetical protein PC129_g10072 [Phytophthora cactorum]|uniref:CCHC-type domain-containing protein n=1 Tax=Phytophthora cactorum TaxID=29920 RepID=A0A8T1D9R3_9STRA|nr:hypothetical protein Pcac1_g6947 [Phytophthora cactorum]KAG2806849.1 hypothetical protein PC112_g17668 [Phytophthora cactorum]KAG2937435.1 hypothetical protein PC115_g4241 [Phytophthora cactorum]KAG2969637.1 hypothetical protein PC118_g17327 [Phytophthora cactorum]KAG3067351.1 hypothetical protein PC122_g17384 [Phytophthora cactorum]